MVAGIGACRKDLASHSYLAFDVAADKLVTFCKAHTEDNVLAVTLDNWPHEY